MTEESALKPRFSILPTCRALACIVICWVAGSVFAGAQTTALPKALVRVSELIGAEGNKVEEGLPVRLQGTVTYNDTNGGRFFLQDATGGVAVQTEGTPVSLQAGQVVEVEGMSGLVDEAPVVINPRLKLLGTAPLPAAWATSIRHLLAGYGQNQWVSVTGVVRMAYERTSRLVIEVGWNGSRIPGWVSGIDIARARELADAEVRLRGVCVWDFFPDGRKQKPRLLVGGMDEITLLKRPPNPSELPITTPGSVVRLPRADWGEHRRRVRGVVTFKAPPDWFLFLQAGEESLVVALGEPSLAKPGDLVDVIGFVGPGAYMPLLGDAQVVILGRESFPSPLLLTSKVKKVEELDTRRVTVEGRLVAETTGHGSRRLSLRGLTDAGWLVSVYIGDETTIRRAEASSTFPLHATLRATGVLSVKARQPSQMPELEVLTASPEAVTLLAAPPWSMKQFLLAGVPLFFLLIMSIVLVLAQRRHIQRQTEAETERKRTEGLLRESEKFAATGRMAARIAHEINNPLGGILNAFALVKGSLPPEAETQRWAGMIEREIDRIARIVRRMFELYAKQKDQPEDMVFDHLLSEVADLMQGAAKARGITLTLEPAPAPIRGRQMAAALTQVFYNLVSNAIDASPDGGKISLGIQQKDSAVLLTVRDWGIGIPAEARGRIFEPFFSTKSGTPGSGMGLGLAVSRSLVEAMGGRLDFTSVEGEGTTFEVEVPLVLPAMALEEVAVRV